MASKSLWVSTKPKSRTPSSRFSAWLSTGWPARCSDRPAHQWSPSLQVPRVSGEGGENVLELSSPCCSGGCLLLFLQVSHEVPLSLRDCCITSHPGAERLKRTSVFHSWWTWGWMRLLHWWDLAPLSRTPAQVRGQGKAVWSSPGVSELCTCMVPRVSWGMFPRSRQETRWRWGAFITWGSAVENPPCNVGNVGSMSGQGTKIPHAPEQLSPGTAARGLLAAARGSVCLKDQCSTMYGNPVSRT